MGKPGFIRKLSCAVLLILLPVGCASPRRGVFYRPVNSQVLNFKSDPENLRMVVYPSRATSHRGAVIFIHGGGWETGGPDVPFFGDWEELLAQSGIRAFSIEHRLAPRYRGWDIIEDCIDAVQFVRAKAQEFRIPPDKIALVGYSSGGHLAVMTALAMSDRKKKIKGGAGNGDFIRSAVSFYAPLNPQGLLARGNPEVKKILENFLPLPEAEGKNEQEERGHFLLWVIRNKVSLQRSLLKVSPMTRLHKNMPPILLFHGLQDTLVPPTQSEFFLKQAHVRGHKNVRMVSLPRGDHNFNRSRSHWARQTEQEAVRFILRSFLAP